MNNEMDSVGNRCVVRTSKQMMVTAAIALMLSTAQQQAVAQASEPSGKKVVEAVCIACHGTGKNGAPKIGEIKAWSARTTRSLTELSQSALDGIRKMPPHGGNPALSNTEIKRAIAYMVNESGGNWVEPISKTTHVEERSGEQIVRTYCFKCHQAGVGDAPRIGDRSAWAPRVKQGFEVLSRSAINGHGGMPSRGGVANLTDSEIKAAIMYMWNPVTAKAPAAVAVDPDHNHQIIN